MELKSLITKSGCQSGKKQLSSAPKMPIVGFRIEFNSYHTTLRAARKTMHVQSHSG